MVKSSCGVVMYVAITPPSASKPIKPYIVRFASSQPRSTQRPKTSDPPPPIIHPPTTHKPSVHVHKRRQA